MIEYTDFYKLFAKSNLSLPDFICEFVGLPPYEQIEYPIEIDCRNIYKFAVIVQFKSLFPYITFINANNYNINHAYLFAGYRESPEIWYRSWWNYDDTLDPKIMIKDVIVTDALCSLYKTTPVVTRILTLVEACKRTDDLALVSVLESACSSLVIEVVNFEEIIGLFKYKDNSYIHRILKTGILIVFDKQIDYDKLYDHFLKNKEKYDPYVRKWIMVDRKTHCKILIHYDDMVLDIFKEHIREIYKEIVHGDKLNQLLYEKLIKQLIYTNYPQVYEELVKEIDKIKTNMIYLIDEYRKKISKESKFMGFMKCLNGSSNFKDKQAFDSIINKYKLR